jgi:catechol 2,3-dioxygenase-like lactoylglutathione lyase family enzyme
MLQGRYMHPTIPTSDLARARAWYADKLGLTPEQELPGGLLYRSGGDAWFLLFPSTGAGTARHTIAGWEVDDLDAEAADPAGKAAWFKDSEGNLLGLIQLAQPGPAQPSSQPTPSPSRSRSKGSGGRTLIGPST